MPATTRWRGPGWTTRARAVVDAARRNPNATCRRCGQPFQPGQPIDAGHIRSGDPTSPLAPEHATCNRSAGASEGNRRRVNLTTTKTW
jgi:hypothetical protein